MRIGIFSLAYIPFVGGAELAIKEITDRLPDRDFVCFTHCFDPNWLAEEKVGNVRVIRLGKGGKNYYGHFFQKLFYIFRAWRVAEKLHRERPFDRIWAMMAAYGGLAALLFKLCHPEVPMLLTLQEGDSELHILRRVGIFYPLWRFIFKKADYIQTISNYLADFARRHGARCQIEVVPNGVDISRYTQNKLASQDTQTDADKDFLYPEITYKIRGACFEVWKNFRGSFKEVIVERALKEELIKRGLLVETQKQIPVFYNDKKVGIYIPDMVINDSVIIELKRKPTLTKEDEKQFWMYLKGSVYKLGLLVNFGSKELEIKRRIYDQARNPSAFISVLPKAENQRLSASTIIIITTSRLVHKNGIDILIRAFAELKNLELRTYNLKLLILGSGPDEEKLKKLAQELGVQKEIQFLGHIESEEIPKYLLQADIFVRSSRSEGLGNSFLEAMAAGLPIIGTQVGGIPDFLISPNLRTSQVLRTCDVQNIDARANGLFVEVDNPNDLAEKILLLLENDELRKKLGENGWRLVSEKYSWDSISVKINNIFEKL